MKLTIIAALLLLFVPALHADEYTFGEGVTVPDPAGIPILSWSVNGPTINGDTEVVGMLGLFAMSGFEDNYFEADGPANDWFYSGFVNGTTLPIGFYLSGTADIPAGSTDPILSYGDPPDTVAPEPGTLLLLGSGVGMGLAWKAKKCRTS